MIRNTILLLISTLLSLGLAEALVAVSGMAPHVMPVRRGEFQLAEKPALGYIPIPGVRDRNSLGFRDDEHVREKPPGDFRILVLGDSLMDGFLLESRQDMFHEALETKLRAKHDRIEVLNFGVNGYNTLQEVELYESMRLREFGPDLVVLAYCLNDFSMSNGNILIGLLDEHEKSGQASVVVPSFLHRALAWSHLYRLVRFRIIPTGAPKSLIERLGSEYKILARDTRAESFERLRRIAKRDNFQIALFIFPLFGDMETGRVIDPREFLTEYPYRDRHASVAKMGAATGMQAFDLLPDFQECAAKLREPVAVDFVHPTAAHLGCAAELAGERLLQSDLLGLPAN